ncbi:hypothetical protein D3C87_2040840 [compost metagenome]
MLEKVIAAVGQHHSLATANKQLGPQHRLQFLNRFGQRRLGKLRSPAGGADAALTADFYKRT